ncbi:LysR family transcriptional regulator [Agreia sp. VKM Ac-1783]|uniref:LysR family transcriptional regulator n=1 Tax=Agreia sp. VKM Ac-1783 TaxID=1938889 RepID=UPI000A2AB50C|nr:LysR family transcriptional regulator [Agreia sp. VKM Ac-1783]SMQ74230.1 DNA-binding transcriptional regulator, LysR family [Agreia sp. VKM Ac-1783]
MLSTHRLHLLNQFKLRGTVTQVAEALAYSPSAVSQQLAQLETEAGSRLFEPAGRGIRLTPQGEVLAAHAARILRLVEEAETDLASADQVRGEIKIATFQTAALTLIPALLADLRRLHPELIVRFRVLQPDLAINALLAHDYDLVLGEEYEGQELSLSPAVDRLDFLKDQMRAYCPSGLKSDAANFEDLEGLPWVMEPSGKPARAWAESLCRQHGFEPLVRFESDDLVVHQRLIATGHAVAILPDLIMRSEKLVDTHVITAPAAPSRTVFQATRRASSGRLAIVAARNALRSEGIRFRCESGPI